MKRFVCISLIALVSVCVFGQEELSRSPLSVDYLTLGNWKMGTLVSEDSTFAIGPVVADSLFNDSIFVITPGRNVGLGTKYPKQMLHVVGGNILISKKSGPDNRAPGSVNGSILFGDSLQDMGRWGIEYITRPLPGLNFWRPWVSGYDQGLNYGLFLRDNGNVGIGCSNPQYKLDVYGAIRAREVLVNLNGTGADFVFDSEYVLPSLGEVEEFVQTNKHLPSIPSAKEMEERGVNVNELQIQLLQKIEELTLYIIEQEKKIELLQEQLDALTK